MLTPCRGCTKRHTTCHTDCESYEEYRRELEKIKALRDKDKDYRAVLIARMNKGKYSRWMSKYRRNNES